MARHNADSGGAMAFGAGAIITVGLIASAVLYWYVTVPLVLLAGAGTWYLVKRRRRQRLVAALYERLPAFAGSAVRATNADRDQVVIILSRAFSTGALDIVEFERRCDLVVGSTVRGELWSCIRDLPGIAVPLEPKP